MFIRGTWEASTLERRKVSFCTYAAKLAAQLYLAARHFTHHPLQTVTWTLATSLRVLHAIAACCYQRTPVWICPGVQPVTVVSKHSVRPVCHRFMEHFSSYPDSTAPYTDHHFFQVQLFVPVILLPFRNYKRVYTIQLCAIRVYIWSSVSVQCSIYYALQSCYICERIKV